MRRPLRVLPSLVLAGGVVATAAFLALTTALQMPVLASLDESVYKLSAAQYASGGIEALFDDRVARGAARLYSLVASPLFAVLPGDAAVKAARVLNCFLFSLAAVPVYLLARRVVASPWKAVAAGLLSIAVPWALVSTVMFSEALAYLLFASSLAAMASVLRDPSPWREALALALLIGLVLTRPQFFVLPVAWFVVVLATQLPALRRSATSWRGAGAALVRRFPVMFGLIALAIVAALGVAAVQGPGSIIRRAGGPYVENRNQLPDDVGYAALFELAMFALGTGVVPLVLAGVWFKRALGRAAGAEAFRVALLGVVMLGATYLVAVLAQRGWQGPDVSEERYYVYTVPLIFLGAVAALDIADLRAKTIAWGGALVACLVALAPTTAGLTGERAFLVPVAASSRSVADRINPWLTDTFGLVDATSQRDLMVVVVLAVLALALLLWRRARWLALVPALALQLAFFGYAFATMHGHVPGVNRIAFEGDTKPLTWIDRSTPGDRDVWLLEDRSELTVRETLGLSFWNDELRGTLPVRGLGSPAPPYPVSALPEEVLSVSPELRVEPAPPARLIAAEGSSPLVQLAAREVARRPEGGAILELEQPVRATWVARGLTPDAGVASPVQVTSQPGRLTLEFEGTGVGGGVRVDLGGQVRRASMALAEVRAVRVTACSGDGPVAGTLTPEVQPGGGVRLRTVRVEPCP